MRRSIRFAAVLISLTLAGIAHAQEVTPQTLREALQNASDQRALQAAIQAAEAAERNPAPQGPPPTRFDLEFPGGTIAQYVAAIRAANPTANIATSPEVVDIRMEPVSLKQVTTAAAIELVSRDIGAVETGLRSVRVSDIKNMGAPEPVFNVVTRSHPAQITSRTAVISLADVISRTAPVGIKVEDILSAIEAATSLTSPPANIRFHAETKLLLLHGSEDQLTALHATIEALHETATAAARAAE